MMYAIRKDIRNTHKIADYTWTLCFTYSLDMLDLEFPFFSFSIFAFVKKLVIFSVFMLDLQ